MKPVSPAVSPARAVAFDVLLRVRTQHSFAAELLHSEVAARLSPADHGLATELVMGTLRWRSRLDAAFTAHLTQPLQRPDPEVLTALELGAYQLLLLDRIPARAAIHESVELVKRARKRSATGMVNAVLRKVAAQVQPDGVPAALDAAGGAAELAEAAAHPLWLVERWVARFGLETTRAIARRNQQTPEVSFLVRGDAARADAALAKAGVTWETGALLRRARRLRHGDLTRTAAFREGAIATQDEGSCLVALLVGHGSRVLDVCAAPGGKTAVIAGRNPQAAVYACELHPHRAAMMRRLLHAPNVRVVAADARALPLCGFFDRILVDAPCSGTGTLGRNPESKWALIPADLADLHGRQVAILAAALRALAPGGKLLYSTCSLEQEENENVIAEVLAMPEFSAPVALVPIASSLRELEREGELVPGFAETLTRGDFLATLPGLHPCDGFFAALLERRA
jgi:16S rRNA (cytosine967-C5)-methyltransferase